MATIVHVDMDAFFCAVETLLHPEYKGCPLIVGGAKNTPRAVVSSCSYEARKYGVHAAMPLQQAIRLCPHGIFVPPNMSAYLEVSQQIHTVFRQIAPVVEPVSIDEAYLDMTGCEHFYPNLEALGADIKNRVYAAVHCRASVGVAPNKLLAKIASDLRKPDGLVIVRPQDIDTLLLPLPVRKIGGVGEKTATLLAQHSIHTIADLRQKSEQWLSELFGSWGHELYYLARGIDNRSVGDRGAAKSIGHEITFAQDLPFGEDLQNQLRALCHQVSLRLQADGRRARTINLKVRYANFHTLTRQQTHSGGLWRAADIYQSATSLLNALPKRRVRLLGVYLSDLTAFIQVGLFQDPRIAQVDDLIRHINSGHNQPRITTGADLATAQDIKKPSPKGKRLR